MFSGHKLICVFGMVCPLLAAKVSMGDSYDIIGGGMIAGKPLPTDPKSEIVKILTAEGIEIEIPRKLIKTSTSRTIGQFETDYAKMVSNKDDSIESHKAIASFCNANQKDLLSKAHLERVVELDPNDSQAWAGLGYSNNNKDGRWIRRDTIKLSQGLVKNKERAWVTLHAKVIHDIEEKQKKDKAEIESKINRHIKNVNRTDRLGIEASEFFKNLNDPLAVDAIAEQLKVGDGPRVDFFLDILARMPANVATGKLIELALNSKSPTIVNVCLELLMRTESSTDLALNGFLGALKDAKTKDRAASNLQTLGDERAVYPLLTSLWTTITTTQASPANNTFSPGGGVQSTMGNTVKTNKQTVPHQAVLTALTTLTGENKGFDTQQWLIWYATKYADTNLNLRRSE